MINISISDKYFVTKDKYQFIVRERYSVTDKDSENYGEEKSRPVAYYKTIHCLVEFMIRQEMTASDCESFLQLEALIKEFGRTCEEAFKNLT